MFLFSKASGPPKKFAACGPHGGILEPGREAVKPEPGGVEAVVLSSIGWDIPVFAMYRLG